MEQQKKLQDILMNIATRYINIELSEVKNTLDRTLGEMATFVEADRAYIFDYVWERGVCSNTYEWCNEDISPEKDNLRAVPLQDIPQWVDTHRQGNTMYIPDVSALPENNGVRKILDPQNVKSLITLPIMDETLCVGFVGFDSVKKHHVYTEKAQALLLLFAQMIVNVRNREESDIKLQNYAAQLEEKNNQLYSALSKVEVANRVKSDFLANMSHELMTPMNAIMGFGGLLLERTRLTEPQGSYTQKIMNAAERLKRIINGMFDFSKMESGTFKLENNNFNLDEMLSTATEKASATAAEKGVVLLTEKSPEVPIWLNGDSCRLGQAIEHLVENGVKFTEMGQVTLEVNCTNSCKDGPTIEFCIEDTGIGMTAEQVKQIFTPFGQADTSSTRRYDGTGLGLVLVKNIVELMDGKITVESDYGVGSRFCLTVKLKTADFIK